MKHGAVRIDLKDGEVVGVSVGTGLDASYANLVNQASTEALSVPSRDGGVKVVLFGCLWLEALCNANLHELLESADLPEPTRLSLWKALERVQTAIKLDILASIEAPEDSELLKHVRALFQLRNRLAHFKEEFTEVPAPHAVHDDAFFDKLPETELAKLLIPPALESRISHISQTKEWLDKVKRAIDERQHLQINQYGTNE